LVEVLVVIGIISIILSILFYAFEDSRDNSSNSSIRAELKEIELAIETYRLQNGSYPTASNFGVTDCRSASTRGGDYVVIASSYVSGSGGSLVGCPIISGTQQPYIDGLIPGYLSGLPNRDESRNSDCIFRYIVTGDQSSYKLIAENCFAGAAAAADGVQQIDEFARCPESCDDPGGVHPAECEPSEADFYNSLAIYSVGGACY